MVKRLVDVDITNRSDGRVPVWDDTSNTHIYEDQGGGAAESWETVVADLTGKVHRWTFEEASGDIIDQISTLDLTVSGAATYAAASPLGDAVSFTGGFAEAAGMGSIPVGDAARTMLAVWKKNAAGTLTILPILAYGNTTNTEQLFQLYASNASNILLNIDGATPTASAMSGDGNWHLSAAFHAGTGTRLIGCYQDGIIATFAHSANLATATTTFHVAAEFDDTDPAAITVADVIVFDRCLAKWELDRLYAALRAALA